MGRQPVRTCIACRRSEPRDRLLRLVAGPSGQVVVDARARLPGRGAWVHPHKACTKQLHRRLGRALGLSGPVSGLEPLVLASVVQATAHAVSLCARAGLVVSGQDAVRGLLRAGRAQVIIAASDSSPGTLDRVRSSSEDDVRLVVTPWSKNALGALMGRAPRAVAGVRAGAPTRFLTSQLDRLDDLGYEGEPVKRSVDILTSGRS